MLVKSDRCVHVCVSTCVRLCICMCSGRDDHLTGEERRASEFLTESDLERNVSLHD